MIGRVSLVVCLGLAIIVSALGVVNAKHDTRQLFEQLQQVRVARDHLHARWSQLELEESTWASPGRITRIAHDSLDMRSPTHYDVLRSGS